MWPRAFFAPPPPASAGNYTPRALRYYPAYVKQNVSAAAVNKARRAYTTKFVIIPEARARVRAIIT